MFQIPILVVTDKALAKKILIKDFDHFVDRQDQFQDVTGTEGAKITAKMMLALKGEEWRKVRAMMSPVFTSGKLKSMVHHLEKVCKSSKINKPVKSVGIATFDL